MNKTYDWIPTESAHELYPMYVVSGDVYYSGEKSIYVPSKAIFNQGWGTTGSVHVAGEDKKGIPERLKLQYFSYVENQFYQGDFELDTKAIAALFAEKQYSIQSIEYTTFHWVIVGCGPGGTVAVWLATPDRVVQVFYGRASKTDLPWEWVAKDSEDPREEFVSEILSHTLDEEQTLELEKRGINPDYMDQFQQRYPWFLTFDSIKMPNFVDGISFLNGEYDFFFQPFQQTMSTRNWPVPNKVKVHWHLNGSEKRVSELHFNQDSIMDAFASLSPQLPSVPMELYLKPNEAKQGKEFIAKLRKKVPDTEKEGIEKDYIEVPIILDSVSTTGSAVRDIYLTMTEETKITTGWAPIVEAEEEDK